jgi:hypothetical protein
LSEEKKLTPGRLAELLLPAWIAVPQTNSRWRPYLKIGIGNV